MNSQPSIERLTVIFGLVLLAMACVVQTRKIDCSRFVFAPRCRGVAAKRGENLLLDSQPINQQQQQQLEPNSNNEDDEIRKLQRVRLVMLMRKLQREAELNSKPMTGDDLWNSFLRSRQLRH